MMDFKSYNQKIVKNTPFLPVSPIKMFLKSPNLTKFSMI